MPLSEGMPHDQSQIKLLEARFKNKLIGPSILKLFRKNQKMSIYPRKNSLFTVISLPPVPFDFNEKYENISL